MLCCECIKNFEKLEVTKEDIVLVNLSKSLTRLEIHNIKQSLDKHFGNKVGKIVIVPNMINIKIGKYTNLTALKSICEHLIMECDEVISRRCMQKNDKQS